MPGSNTPVTISSVSDSRMMATVRTELRALRVQGAHPQYSYRTRIPNCRAEPKARRRPQRAGGVQGVTQVGHVGLQPDAIFQLQGQIALTNE